MPVLLQNPVAALRAAARSAVCIDTQRPAAYPAGPIFSACIQGLYGHETYLPAEQTASRAYARVSCPYGHPEWTQGIEPPARQGPKASDSLSLPGGIACTAALTCEVQEVPTFTLGPERRLRRAADFRQLYASGRRLGAEPFTAVVRPNQQGAARLGLSIAARNVRRAVHRNRVRRLIRESFRQCCGQLPALDIVVGVRSGVQAVSNARLRASLDGLWQKIASTCERSSAS